MIWEKKIMRNVVASAANSQFKGLVERHSFRKKNIWNETRDALQAEISDRLRDLETAVSRLKDTYDAVRSWGHREILLMAVWMS